MPQNRLGSRAPPCSPQAGCIDHFAPNKTTGSTHVQYHRVAPK